MELLKKMILSKHDFIAHHGIANIDLGFLKNVRITEGHSLQIRADLYDATNTRNFGIPEGRVTAASFLNQWGTDGGNRRVILGLRYNF